MKKLLYISGIIIISISIMSCTKNDAVKDLDLCIAKLNQFNQKFAELNKDGVIAKDTVANAKESEFDQLKKIAGEYYDAINKINSNIKEEHEKVAKGKKSAGYEDAYKKAIETKKAEIDKATALFIENINKIGNIEPDIIDEIPVNVETDTIPSKITK